MKLLFIGGTGIISTDVVHCSIREGHNVYILHRGNQPVPSSSRELKVDIYKKNDVKNVLKDQKFDVIIDFISYKPEDLSYKLDLLRGCYKQYIFISSTAVYGSGYNDRYGKNISAIHSNCDQKISEDNTPTANFGWDYARNKIACEHELIRENRLYGCDFTIVRPCETYNNIRIPAVIVPQPNYYTHVWRMLNGKKIIVHDDGEASAPFTHATDFARAFVKLYLNEMSYGEAFHITTSEMLSWNELIHLTAKAVGVKAKICYLPSKTLTKLMPQTPHGNTYGVVMCSKQFGYPEKFDNTKIRRIAPDFQCKIPFETGILQTIEYYNKHIEFKTIDYKWDKKIDAIVNRFS